MAVTGFGRLLLCFFLPIFVATAAGDFAAGGRPAEEPADRGDRRKRRAATDRELPLWWWMELMYSVSPDAEMLEEEGEEGLGLRGEEVGE